METASGGVSVAGQWPRGDVRYCMGQDCIGGGGGGASGGW